MRIVNERKGDGWRGSWPKWASLFISRLTPSVHVCVYCPVAVSNYLVESNAKRWRWWVNMDSQYKRDHLIASMCEQWKAHLNWTERSNLLGSCDESDDKSIASIIFAPPWNLRSVQYDSNALIGQMRRAYTFWMISFARSFLSLVRVNNFCGCATLARLCSLTESRAFNNPGCLHATFRPNVVKTMRTSNMKTLALPFRSPHQIIHIWVWSYLTYTGE